MSFKHPVRSIEYTTLGLQEFIDVGVSGHGAFQVDCSDDAEYDIFGSIHSSFPPLPLPEGKGAKGPLCLGGFYASQILQINVRNLGASGKITAQIVVR